MLNICSQNVLNSEGTENVASYVRFINRDKWCNSYFQGNLFLVLKHMKKICRLGLKIRACTIPNKKHNVILHPEPFKSLNIAWILSVIWNIFCKSFAVIWEIFSNLYWARPSRCQSVYSLICYIVLFMFCEVFTSQKYRRRYWLKC